MPFVDQLEMVPTWVVGLKDGSCDSRLSIVWIAGFARKTRGQRTSRRASEYNLLFDGQEITLPACHSSLLGQLSPINALVAIDLVHLNMVTGLTYGCVFSGESSRLVRFESKGEWTWLLLCPPSCLTVRSSLKQTPPPLPCE